MAEEITLDEVKRGDTFTLLFRYKEGPTKATAVPVDLTPYTITAQVRDSLDNLLSDLVVAKADNQGTTGKGIGTASPATNPPTSWPIDRLKCDVQFARDGVIRSTRTFYFPMVPDVTRGA